MTRVPMERGTEMPHAKDAKDAKGENVRKSILAVSRQLIPPRKSRRHAEHRGKPVSVSTPGRRHSGSLKGSADAWSSLYNNASKFARAGRILPLHRQPSDHRKMAAAAWFFVPEGRRRKLAGGKPAPAGAAPGYHAECGMPQRGIGEVFGVAHLGASPPPLVASGRSDRRPSPHIPGHFFDAPPGHGGIQHGFRGRRPLARTGPRLISSGVPLGRKPGGHARTKGIPGRRNCLPNSFGCGSATQCSSCLWGSSGSSPLPSDGLAGTMRSERGLQAAETCVLQRTNELSDGLFRLTERWVVVGVPLVWGARCGWTLLRPEGRAPVFLCALRALCVRPLAPPLSAFFCFRPIPHSPSAIPYSHESRNLPRRFRR